MSFRFWYYSPRVLVGAMGFAANIPTALYAIAFPDTDVTDVSIPWFEDISPARKTLAIYTGVSTLIISGAFGAKYIWVAMEAIKAEATLFIKHQKNTTRFLIETTVGLLSGVTGGLISSDPYSGGLKYAAAGLGFIAYGSFSFLRVFELIARLTDKDIAFQQTLLNHFKQIDPQYYPRIVNFVEGDSLSPETVSEFIRKVLDVAVQCPDSFFTKPKPVTTALKYSSYAFDVGLSGVLSVFSIPIVVNSGFQGANIILNNKMADINSNGKVAVGFLTGFSLVLFDFFNMMDFRSQLIEWYPDIKQHPKEIMKATLLLLLSLGNSAWFYSLAYTTAEATDNITPWFSTPSSRLAFEIAALLTSLLMGLIGLAPMALTLRHNVSTVDGITKWIKHHKIPKVGIEALRSHSFFFKPRGLAPRVEENSDLLFPQP